jgi:hypothetical protein
MRKAGYYWVKYKGEWHIHFYTENENWVILTRNGNGEAVAGLTFNDSDFEEIDENRIERENKEEFKGMKIIKNDLIPPGELYVK